MSNRERAEAFICFAAGFGLGAAAVLITAPQSGSETRHLLARKSMEGVTQVIGEERIEQGRQMYDRAGEVRNLARDTIDIVQRVRRVTRPLAAESNQE